MHAMLCGALQWPTIERRAKARIVNVPERAHTHSDGTDVWRQKATKQTNEPNKTTTNTENGEQREKKKVMAKWHFHCESWQEARKCSRIYFRF